MKRLLQVILASGVMMAALVACRKDLGNYDYSNINAITIVTDTVNANRQMVVNNDLLVIKQGDTLKVNVILTQTQPSDDLSFSWMVTQRSSTLRNPAQYVLGNEQQLNARILMTPEFYNLVLKVTDNKTGVSYYKTYTLYVSTSPWGNEGWLILQDDRANGGSDLSVITSRDGVSRGEVYNNVYYLANGRKLPFDTYKVNVINHIYSTVGAQKISFFYPNGGVQVRGYDFTDSSTNNYWFAVSPPVTNLQYNACVSNSSYEFLINDNQVHTRILSKSALDKPPVLFSAPVLGTWSLAPFAMYNSSIGNVATLYDKQYKSFLLFNGQSNTVLPTTLPDVPNKHMGDYPAAAKPALDTSGYDLNNIGLNLLHAENVQPLPGSGTCIYDCFFRNNSGDSTFIIQLTTVGAVYTNNNTTGKNLLKTDSCPGIRTASIFACPTFLSMPGKFYYAAGNDIYTATVRAYPRYSVAKSSHSFATGTVVKAMKVFRSDYTALAVPSTESRVLVIATDETASGGGHKVYFFKIDPDGDIIQGATQVYTGFNKIVDIAFKKGLGF